MDNPKYRKSIFSPQVDYSKLAFFQKSDVLYQMTVVFCRRFLPKYGDRTVDQMVQAARSGKQNFAEGFADGVTSIKMMLELLNVGRSSLRELHEDYLDYLKSHGKELWNKNHDRYRALLAFCKHKNKVEDYQPFFEKWSDEEFCNVAVSLCHFVDKMVENYMKKIEEDFIMYGGISERMHSVRTGYRDGVDERLRMLEAENERLKNILRENGIAF